MAEVPEPARARREPRLRRNRDEDRDAASVVTGAASKGTIVSIDIELGICMGQIPIQCSIKLISGHRSLKTLATLLYTTSVLNW